jgi:hypothetical protein
MAVNWGLSGGNGFQNALAAGLQIGQTIKANRDEETAANALTSYIANPSQDDATFASSLKGLPAQAVGQLMQARQGYQQNAARTQQAQTEQRRADLPMITRLLETSTDETSYQRNRQEAQRLGIDTSSLPQQFDPAWRDQQLTTMKALQTPQGQEAMSNAGKQAMDMGYKPGTPEFNAAVRDIFTASEAKPYVVGGETRLYQPKIGGAGEAMGGIPPSAIEALRKGEGKPEEFDEIFGAGAAAKILGTQGGQTQPASGGFRRPVTVQTANFNGLAGEKVTSTYRDPARNKRVGGVSNSYHMRRDANGNPLARDSVPPRGMSMAQYAAVLRRENPDKDVINEGDHVHMEPKG